MRSLGTVLVAAAVIVFSGCGEVSRAPQANDGDQLVDQSVSDDLDFYTVAKRRLREGDAEAAWDSVQQCLLVDPDNVDVLELAGDIAAILQNPTRTMEMYQAAIEHASVPSRRLLDKAGREWMKRGRPFEAVAVLRIAVSHYPSDAGLRADLAGLLAAVGLEYEAGTHLRWLVMRGHAGLNELVMVSDLTRPQCDEAIMDYALKHAPGDTRMQFTKVRKDAYHGRWQNVVDTLKSVVQEHPDFVTASAYYGRALVETGEVDAAADWASRSTPALHSVPQYWMAIAAMAERGKQHSRAIAAYCEAHKLDPSDGEVLGKLATSLAQAGFEEEALLATERAGLTGELRVRIDQLRTNYDQSRGDFVLVAKSLKKLGRLWEAAAWLRVGSKLPEEFDSELKDLYLVIHGALSAKTPWQSEMDLPPDSVGVADLAKVDWQTLSSETQKTSSASLMKGDRPIQFADEADSRNLNHVCEIRAPVEGSESGLWLYQTGAGGAATLDFDLDGWPDIYLTKLDGTPMRRDSLANAMYRNLSGKFSNVTALAEVGDTGFSQGIAVGDYNSDGFDDLYVANIGVNHLYQNCGDGTFRDVTEVVGLNAAEWTASVAMVDIDQDGNLDLFDVGYCGGERALKEPCDEDGRVMACLPKSFPAQRDRVLAGTPNGEFADQTERWLGPHSIAHGLGIVAGFFDEDDGIDLYVANDMSGNHFWSSGRDSDKPFRLDEEAMLRGLAVDTRSLAQASMGIAVGDPDSDGDTDFYLTHFSGEYNTYYEQIRPGVWADLTSAVQLSQPTIPMLAFGTAWMDADNDGRFELMVANGHLNEQGSGYRMPMQFFRRQPDGTWTALTPRSLGPYFETKRLGRSLITLDADRDGRIDALVTHLFDPVSLLINRTETPSRAVRFFLVGQAGHGSAIGSTVAISVGDRHQTQQLTTGSGYQASSQRCITFGLAPDEIISELSIRWASGRKQTFLLDNSDPMLPGEEYLLVEGDDSPFRYLKSYSSLEPSTTR